MSENRKDIAVVTDRAASTRARAEWRRPEYRKLNASEAEISVAGSADVSTIFS